MLKGVTEGGVPTRVSIPNKSTRTPKLDKTHKRWGKGLWGGKNTEVPLERDYQMRRR